ncbi:unnamed protein product [Moneuplotes crassus]|uniref:Ankyrin repeat protein n=1 Tax=Euplotes crassus TaxID=5936 RepID=A0AAD2D0W6_EUPCR|nr:unnamed protein product [Moneuplotes crassus]
MGGSSSHNKFNLSNHQILDRLIVLTKVGDYEEFIDVLQDATQGKPGKIDDIQKELKEKHEFDLPKEVCKYGNYEIYKYLKEKSPSSFNFGLDQFDAKGDGVNCIHLAVKNNQREFIELLSPSKEEINQKTKEKGETPLFFSLKYIRDADQKKLMLQSLKELGADPHIKNDDGLLAHQAYEDEYYNIFKPNLKRSKLGHMFELTNLTTSSEPAEIKEAIFNNWREFISQGSPSDRIEEDLSFAISEKERILRKFNNVQGTDPLDAHKTYNSEDSLRIQLKRKQLEVISRDILRSFDKYH